MTNFHDPHDQSRVLQSAIRAFLRNSRAFITPSSPAWDALCRPLAKALTNCDIAAQQAINISEGQRLGTVSPPNQRKLRSLYAKRHKLYLRRP